MRVNPGPGEPVVETWTVLALTDLVDRLHPGPLPGRPRVVAVDGRGAGGKSTLAGRLARAVEGAVVVSTDDVAWNHSFFGWDEVLVEGLLRPLHAGRAVAWQPPGWAPHGRTGQLRVEAGTPLVLVEGCGASRTSLLPWLDAAVWTQSDFAQAETRGIDRDVAGGEDRAEVTAFWHEWMTNEVPFFLVDRPWARADVVVGTSDQHPHDPDREVLVAAHRPRPHD